MLKDPVTQSLSNSQVEVPDNSEIQTTSLSLLNPGPDPVILFLQDLQLSPPAVLLS